MENKINIAGILKDCPKGMELDCTMFEGLEFDGIVDNEFLPIRCRIKNSKGGYNIHNFTEYGQWDSLPYAKCVIFPKGKTTWEGFQRPFKDGDIVATDIGMWIGIVKKLSGGDTYEVYVGINTYCTNSLKYGSLSFSRPATEEEKQKLFDAIKANGYKWNSETKTLEKLLKFKVGDKIVKKDNPTECWYVQGVDTNCNLDYFYHIVSKGKIANLHFKEQDDWELVPHKFDVTTLKPFESRVLVRNVGVWIPAFWGYYSKEYIYPFVVDGGNTFAQCIPYKGNEHLLGTANDCDEYYKNWE